MYIYIYVYMYTYMYILYTHTHSPPLATMIAQALPMSHAHSSFELTSRRTITLSDFKSLLRALKS